jgi:RNA polymerase sigma-70 factor (ECF subfamily)
MVLAAGRSESPESRAALASLCELYWYPLYAFVRRQGHAAHDAEDLTQGFFASLLDRDALGELNPERGKFRAFLLACLKHFLANERDRERALKRGGGKTIVSLDAASAEQRWRLEPADELTPDDIFLRGWALTLLERTLSELRSEFEASGRGELFDHLKVYLTGEATVSQADVAAKFGMTHDAVKAAVYRLRDRFRRRLREAIADTVAEPDAIEDEMRELFAALG